MKRSSENRPLSVVKKGNQSVLITWDDGHISRYDFRYLRQQCACAGCVDEATGLPRLDPNTVPLDLSGLKIEQVGNYALSFSFSDNHNTGIYHFGHLRGICPCDICKVLV